MTEDHVEIKTIKMSNGIDFPMIGLGTFRTAESKHALIDALKYAIKIGYRHIDGAWLYGNEDAIGQAIKEAIAESNNQLKREDLFIVSKVWNTHHSRELVRKCLNETLNNLGTDYIDLYLIHWPMGFAENTGMEPFPKDEQGNRLYSDIHYVETYKAMEELVKEGKIKSIGISNFNINQTQEILDNCEIRPVTNQIEVNPYLHNEKLVEFCQRNQIIVSAYGPIGGGQSSTNIPDLPILLENQTIKRIASKYNKTPAQICLRWGVQRNLVVLPKSITNKRILENAQIFDFQLSEDDMSDIKSLNRNFRVYGVESLSQHKFYPFHED